VKIVHICLVAALYNLFFQAFAQSVYTRLTFEKEISFVKYLLSNEDYENANYLLKKIFQADSLTLLQQDSVNYMLGWNYYNTKQLDSSITYLLKVNQASSQFYKSQFFSAYNNAYLNRQVKAKAILLLINTNMETELEELRNFELAGIALLNHKFKNFDSISNKFSYSNYAIAKEQKNLFQYGESLKKVPKRSPLLAGILSSVIPGLGKGYAGKTNEGVSAFLYVGVLGAVSYESYKRGGVKSPRFIFFSSLFTSFYVGNIWGSILSVKIKREETYDEINNNILFDMHIPLRTIFN